MFDVFRTVLSLRAAVLVGLWLAYGLAGAGVGLQAAETGSAVPGIDGATPLKSETEAPSTPEAAHPVTPMAQPAPATEENPAPIGEPAAASPADQKTAPGASVSPPSSSAPAGAGEIPATPAILENPAGSGEGQNLSASPAKPSSPAVQQPVYICPMHPHVHSHAPGQCPICGMDLVLKPTGPAATMAKGGNPAWPPPEDSAELTLPDAVVNELGVRTATVRRGTLIRHIRGPGVFLRTAPRANRPPVQDMASGVIADPPPAGSVVTVLAQVFEREAPLVHPGQPAQVRFPGLSHREWSGFVSSTEAQISQTTHTLPVRVTMDVEDETVIPAGMSAIVTISLDPLAGVLLVPREAVIVTGKGARVIMAREGGRFQPRSVIAEAFGEDEALIHAGLAEGERVVVSAQFLLDAEANLQTGLRRLTSPAALPTETPEP